MWQSSPDGWVTTALLDAGIGLRDVWETVAGLYERVRLIPHAFTVTHCAGSKLITQGEEDREFLEEEAGVVFSRWLKEKTSIPAAEVCLFASSGSATSHHGLILNADIPGGAIRVELLVTGG
jgi:nuclear pore complex protein Nup155